jgi:hypothetical protein
LTCPAAGAATSIAAHPGIGGEPSTLNVPATAGAGRECGTASSPRTRLARVGKPRTKSTTSTTLVRATPPSWTCGTSKPCAAAVIARRSRDRLREARPRPTDQAHGRGRGRARAPGALGRFARRGSTNGRDRGADAAKLAGARLEPRSPRPRLRRPGATASRRRGRCASGVAGRAVGSLTSNAPIRRALSGRTLRGASHDNLRLCSRRA